MPEIEEQDAQTVRAYPKPLPKNRFIAGSDINAYRDSLVEDYLGQGHCSVLSKVKEHDEATTSDEILGLIIEEILEGGRDIFGTQLMLAEEGNLRDSAAAVVKRTEILRSVADIVAKRKELNQRASEIDLNSPAFLIFQKICFDKMMEALDSLKIDEEMVALIVSRWSDLMKDWGKLLKQRLEEMSQ